ncbi:MULTISPECIES: hypothetical protein [Rhizobium]|uniref:hypothetical protein n=1 Tax=Rhizobium TaxID=379 RepID=UPI0028AF4A56
MPYKPRIAMMAAVAMFATACPAESNAQTPEEAVMFMVFGVHDKDALDAVVFEKSSDNPLTLQFKVAHGGLAPRSLMALSVAKEGDCRYVVGITPAEGAQNPMPNGKFRFDLSNLTKVTFVSGGEVKLEGASVQCVESPGQCASFDPSTAAGQWQTHLGPVAAGTFKEVKGDHQQALDKAVEEFKANICKP